MYYIVGTSHNFQCCDGQDDADANEFSRYISTLCKEHNICCIAEEFNEEASSEMECHEVVCITVASTLDIDHVFIDPNRDERSAIGISDLSQLSAIKFFKGLSDEEYEERIQKEFRIRERYWLDKIKEYEQDEDCDILIVVGANHVDSFTDLLSEEDEDYSILDSDYSLS